MEMILPRNYQEVGQEEMQYLEGGFAITELLALATLVIGTVGATYKGGQALGERVYYSGYTNKQYQKDKWKIRAAVVGLAGPIFGVSVMMGFENKFYSYYK